MVVQMVLLGAASILGSGVLFAHRRVTVFLALTGILWEAQWLFLTLLDRTLFRAFPTEMVFWVGAGIFVVGWAALYRRFTWPKFSLGDVAVAVVAALPLAAACLIFQVNSFSQIDWKTHGFFNGDTATLIAITQKAFLTGGLVTQNPFAGNGPLEYPSLLHSGLATLLRSSFEGQAPWVGYLPVLTYIQILLTVPMFFLLWDEVLPAPRETWKLWLGAPSRAAILCIQALIAVWVMMLSWESYVYPQGHFFLMGLFLAMAALLARAWGGKLKSTFPELGVAVLLGIVLLFSNAVTGTAAVLLKIIFDGLHVIKRGASLPSRLGWAVGVVFWVVLFLLFTPGNGSLGIIPGFAYTAAHELGRLSPALILLVIGIYLQFGRKFFSSAAAGALMAVAFITFVFSTRGIVVENASRFFYHALLVGFPLTLVPLMRAYYWFTREFIWSSRLIVEKILGWGLVAILLGTLLLPAGASVASTHDNLMFKDEQVVTAEMFEAAEDILRTTDPDAVILGPPDPPFWIPMLTGRALPRTNFWLSPELSSPN